MKLATLLLSLTLLVGCNSRHSSSAKEEQEKAQRQLNKECFIAGYACAVLAHQQWLNEKLTNGILPSRVGMEPLEWKARAEKLLVERYPTNLFSK